MRPRLECNVLASRRRGAVILKMLAASLHIKAWHSRRAIEMLANNNMEGTMNSRHKVFLAGISMAAVLLGTVGVRASDSVLKAEAEPGQWAVAGHDYSNTPL